MTYLVPVINWASSEKGGIRQHFVYLQDVQNDIRSNARLCMSDHILLRSFLSPPVVFIITLRWLPAQHQSR